MTGPTHIGDVARGAGTPRNGGAAERRLDGIAYENRTVLHAKEHDFDSTILKTPEQ